LSPTGFHCPSPPCPLPRPTSLPPWNFTQLSFLPPPLSTLCITNIFLSALLPVHLQRPPAFPAIHKFFFFTFFHARRKLRLLPPPTFRLWSEEVRSSHQDCQGKFFSLPLLGFFSLTEKNSLVPFFVSDSSILIPCSITLREALPADEQESFSSPPPLAQQCWSALLDP